MKGNNFLLAVNLGTIIPEGADVSSYSPYENGLVKDPELWEHLVHWGIDVMEMEKTDNAMAEMDWTRTSATTGVRSVIPAATNPWCGFVVPVSLA